MKQRRFLIGTVIILGALVYFGFSGFQEGKAYYKTIEELDAMGEDAFEKRIRVAGIVAEGSIRREGKILRFQIEQEEKKMDVVYIGTTPLPDTFKDGAEALCDGMYQPDGTFAAKTIQAKCASKYEAEYGTVESAEPTS